MASIARIVAIVALVAGLAHADPRDNRDRVPDEAITLPSADFVLDSAQFSIAYGTTTIDGGLTVESTGRAFDLYAEWRLFQTGYAAYEFLADDGYGESINGIWRWKTMRAFSGSYSTLVEANASITPTYTLAIWKKSGTAVGQCRYRVRYLDDAGVRHTSSWFYVNDQTLARDVTDVTAPALNSHGSLTVITPFAFAPVAISVSNATISNEDPYNLIATMGRVIDNNGRVAFGGNTWSFGLLGGVIPLSTYGYCDMLPADAVAAGNYLWSLQVRFMDPNGNTSSWTTLFQIDMRDYD